VQTIPYNTRRSFNPTIVSGTGLKFSIQEYQDGRQGFGCCRIANWTCIDAVKSYSAKQFQDGFSRVRIIRADQNIAFNIRFQLAKFVCRDVLECRDDSNIIAQCVLNGSNCRSAPAAAARC
jgi:hypothetical protein